MSGQYNRWTDDELEKLASMLKKGKTYDHIAKEIKRSPYAIQCKAEQYISKRIKESDIDTVATEFKIDKSQLKKMQGAQQKRDDERNQQNNQQNNQPVQQPQTAQIVVNTPLGTVNSYCAINRVLTPFIEFYENKKRLEKIKDYVDDNKYDEIHNIIHKLAFDVDKFINQLKTVSEKCIIQPTVSDSTTEESDVSDDETDDHEKNTGNTKQESAENDKIDFRKRLVKKSK